MDLPQTRGGNNQQPNQHAHSSHAHSQHANHHYSQGGGPQNLTWETLRACLLEEGECMSEQDLDAYLIALTGGDSSSIPANQVIDPKYFAEQLLGFEDFSGNSSM